MNTRCWAIVGAILFSASIAAAAPDGGNDKPNAPAIEPPSAPRVLPIGRLPDDSRLGPLKDFDGYFPFAPSASPGAWRVRAERVRRQILVATGLWPMPTKTPAHAAVYGKVERDGYTVEKVTLESYPGFYVTGSLFRPTGKTGKLPGVLSPHGHFPHGRFFEESLHDIKQQIVGGAERFEVGGRYPLQARCVELARMGCVVFHYDMVGYADSVQISELVAHHLKERRPEMESGSNWGFFSPQAELRLQTIMGLQTYNSVRVLDWFSELADVDPHRIGVTGESGGGTQTMLIGAIDSRPAVLFPAVMVSTAMQGGCTCENCCYLRIGTGNIEFAALAAPRPLGMTAADDWTIELATKGLPQLKQHYAMLGAPDMVMGKPLVQFKHNYNYVSRAVMYGWMNEHLKLGLETPVIEEDFKPLSVKELSVWDDAHPKPPSGLEFERRLLNSMTRDASEQLTRLKPTNAESLAEFHRVVGGAWDVLIGRALPDSSSVSLAPLRTIERNEYSETAALVRYLPAREEVPVLLLKPKNWNRKIVIWLDGAGRQGLFDGEKLKPALQQLIESGSAVLGADLLYQGEFLADGKPLVKTRRVGSSRDYAGFTYGYNHPLPAARTHDVLSIVAAVRNLDDKPKTVALVGVNGAGPVAAAARAQAGVAIDALAIDAGKFRFAGVTSIDDPNFFPGAAKYGDLDSLLALSAPHLTLIAGMARQDARFATAAFDASESASRLTFALPDADVPSTIVQWLAK